MEQTSKLSRSFKYSFQEGLVREFVTSNKSEIASKVNNEIDKMTYQFKHELLQFLKNQIITYNPEKVPGKVVVSLAQFFLSKRNSGRESKCNLNALDTIIKILNTKTEEYIESTCCSNLCDTLLFCFGIKKITPTKEMNYFLLGFAEGLILYPPKVVELIEQVGKSADNSAKYAEIKDILNEGGYPADYIEDLIYNKLCYLLITAYSRGSCCSSNIHDGLLSTLTFIAENFDDNTLFCNKILDSIFDESFPIQQILRAFHPDIRKNTKLTLHEIIKHTRYSPRYNEFVVKFQEQFETVQPSLRYLDIEMSGLMINNYNVPEDTR